MEPIRSVHCPWVEIMKEKDFKWEPTGNDAYTSSTCGGTVRPSVVISNDVEQSNEDGWLSERLATDASLC